MEKKAEVKLKKVLILDFAAYKRYKVLINLAEKTK